MWGIIFCAFGILTSIILICIEAEYKNHETVSNIEVINVALVEFPTVTICYSNPFATKYSEQLLLNYSKESSMVDTYVTWSSPTTSIQRWKFLQLRFNSGFNYPGHKTSIKKIRKQGPIQSFQVVITNLTYVQSNSFPAAQMEGIVIFIHNNTFKPTIISLQYIAIY